MRSERKYGLEIVGVFILSIIVTLLLSNIMLYIRCDSVFRMLQTHKFNLEQFRVMDIDEDILEGLRKSGRLEQEDFWRMITMAMLIGDYQCNEATIDRGKKIIKYDKDRIVGGEKFKQLEKRYKTVLHDIQYFPVACDIDANSKMSFEDSWGEPRSYGGSRRHEGTDIMPPVNERGKYPIVSVTDGVVENLGWLEQGGYRIGIRSKMGGYYYYAHLCSYAPEIKKGDNVIAGQLLGFMGDTGYGKEEGTRGKFAVHLHFGIYYMEGERETSVNPYRILKYLEHSILKYSLE